MKPVKICVLDNNTDQQLSKNISGLLGGNVETTLITEPKKILKILTSNNFNYLIISNEALNGLKDKIYDLVSDVRRLTKRIKIILLIDEDNIQYGVGAIRLGALQYLKIPINYSELELLICPKSYKSKLGTSKQDIQNRKVRFGEIIGNSTPMLKVYDQISQAARTDIPVLILGETGTGKDLVAYTIHKFSQRFDNNYLPINLGALPTELVASELFGHEKGSFTGAMNQHRGVFEQGSKGTVFLDEIDTIDEKVQVSLLRLLEQKKFKRLGGNRSLQSKARLIAATNENIDKLVESGVFRNDLFYRLDVFRIDLPPLRERKTDIPLLIDELLQRYSNTYKKQISSISKDAMDILVGAEWPGNVRELKNTIQRAVIMCNEAEISIKHLPDRLNQLKKNTSNLSIDIGTSLKDVEREMISHVLISTNFNKKETADILGISRRALYNKISKYKI